MLVLQKTPRFIQKLTDLLIRFRRLKRSGSKSYKDRFVII